MLPVGKIHGLMLFVCCCFQTTAQSNLEASALADLAIQFDTLQTLGWNTNGENICDFVGVTCNEEGNITRLDLSHFYFNQNLPETFGQLSHLEWLDIHYNNFTSLPTSFSNLQNLKTLSIRGCFENYLPAEVFRLSKLEKLDVSQNHLEYLDSNIGQLTSLKQFICSENNIQSLPTEVINLINLKDLFIDNNLFNSMPSMAGEITSLSTLSMKNNRITVIDPSFFESSSIKYLYLDNNNVSQIPTTIGEADSLLQLYLNGNVLSELPDEIRYLENIETISLSFNQFKNIPCALGDIESLVNLYFKDNNIESVNDCLLNSEQLYFLTLQGNNLGFEELEKFLGVIPFYIYAPQDSILEKEDIYLLPETNVQLESGYSDPNHRYKWYKNGQVIADETGAMLDVNYDSLAVGKYTCSIVNTNLLALELWRNEITIELIEPIVIDTLNIVNVSCFGNNDASISISASGGMNDIKYEWSNGDTLNYIQQVIAGEYDVTITDQITGTSLEEHFLINEPTPINIQPITIPTTNTTLGSIVLNVDGGTAPYNYIWNNGLTDQNIQENLDFGYYEVNVIDNNGCTENLNWTFEMSTSMNELKLIEKNNINFYPNPTDSSIYIKSDCKDLIHFELINAQGKKVLSSSFYESTNLDVSHLNSGIYFLNVEESDHVFTPKNNRLIKL